MVFGVIIRVAHVTESISIIILLARIDHEITVVSLIGDAIIISIASLIGSSPSSMDSGTPLSRFMEHTKSTAHQSWLHTGNSAIFTIIMQQQNLEVGFLLDRQWYWLRGEMEQAKRPTLLALARVLAEAKTPYAIIGGIALQVHQEEPRTTIHIDVAVATYGQLPRTQLEAAGFMLTGRFSHSENWIGPDNTPVQFTDDPALAEAIIRAEEIGLEDVRLRVLTRVDLLHEKLRTASDPTRRRSKRLQDLADVQGLLETTPELEHELTAEEHTVLEQLPR